MAGGGEDGSEFGPVDGWTAGDPPRRKGKKLRSTLFTHARRQLLVTTVHLPRQIQSPGHEPHQPHEIVRFDRLESMAQEGELQRQGTVQIDDGGVDAESVRPCRRANRRLGPLQHAAGRPVEIDGTE